MSGRPLKTQLAPVVTGLAEPREAGGIARAWIEDPKVCPNALMMLFVPEGLS